MGYEFRCAALSSDALPHCPLVAASAVTQRNNFPGAKGQHHPPPPNNFMFQSLSTGNIFVTRLYSANSSQQRLRRSPRSPAGAEHACVCGLRGVDTRFFVCFTPSCWERGSSATAQRRDPIIRTQFSWLAGNLP